MRILLIEDNRDLLANVFEFLEAREYIVDSATDGVIGLNLALNNAYDVIVLDLMLPGLDGLSLCRTLRKQARHHTPVLMLTARDTLADKLAGFDSGAEDYLIKPFALQELEARLQALSRRHHPAPRVLKVADLTYDRDTLAVQRDGTPITLTPIALKLLEILMREQHRVVTRVELEQAIWGDSPPDSDALRAHMHTLRSAIDKPFDTPLLHTVHGIGYRLTDAHAISALSAVPQYLYISGIRRSALSDVRDGAVFRTSDFRRPPVPGHTPG